MFEDSNYLIYIIVFLFFISFTTLITITLERTRKNNRQEMIFQEKIYVLNEKISRFEYEVRQQFYEMEKFIELNKDISSSNVYSKNKEQPVDYFKTLAEINKKMNDIIDFQKELKVQSLSDISVSKATSIENKKEINQKTDIFDEKINYIQSVSADVAHTLKSPMSGLKLSVSNLKNKLSNDNNFRDDLNDIESMINLIERQVDNYSKLAYYSPEHDLIKGDYIESLENNLKIFLLGINKKINLEVINKEKIMIAKNQFDLLEIPLICIVENAFEMVNDNGRVKVEILRKNSEIKIEIFNDGPHFYQDNDLIFTEGYTTRNSSGRGLALAKEIVEEYLNGKIWATNEDVGVKFHITFLEANA